MRLYLVILFILGCVFRVNAAEEERLLPISPEYKIKKNVTEIDAADIPRYTSQDSLGICYAHVAATMMQMENCRFKNINHADPNKKIRCSDLKAEKLFSPLDLSRIQIKKGEVPSSIRSSYKGLHIEGGNLINAIKFGALVVKQTANQACASLDTILSKLNTRPDVKKAQMAIWEGLQREFNLVKEREKTIDASCKECLSNLYATAVKEMDPSLKEDLDIKTDHVGIQRAFATKTFGEFLNEFLGTANCVRPMDTVKFEASDSVDYEPFPKEGQKTNPNEVMGKVIEVLKGGRPVALNAICYEKISPSDCPNDKYHSVVIAGYRDICNTQGKCRKSFKIINSLGKSWQDQNDDGWIDAETVLASTNMAPGVISYFVDRK